jgi:malonyl-CoA O-methyltransferase
MLAVTSNEKIANHFNRASITYDHHCHMQQFSANKLINVLLTSITHERIIELGCGTGFNTKKIINHLDFRRYDALDFAELPLSHARENIIHPNVNFLLMDFDQLKLEAEISSLIISNMALHWSNNLKKLLTDLYALLLPEGMLAFTFPLKGSLPELKSRRPFLTLDETIYLLMQAQFEIMHTQQYQHITTFDSTQDAIYSLKKTGVTQLTKPSHAGLRGKKYLTTLFNSLQTTPTLTFEIGLFLARKSC